MSIAVLGSINMDLVVRALRLPKPGETLAGHTFQTIPGGKGANQAVACARLGAPTFMVGRVGNDDFGERLKNELKGAGVDPSSVVVDSSISSGVALITVEDSAENMIVIVPGANGKVNDDDLGRLGSVLDQSKVLLLQLETPLAIVVAAAKLANKRGVIVILDPAPAQTLPDDIYPVLDIITPNETETESLVGFPVNTTKDAATAAQILKSRGVKNVIIKMGSHGAFTNLEGKEEFIPSLPVTAIDTVAAGDAFNGAMAVALSVGKPIEEAIRWGMAGGALSVTKEGAQPAMPKRNELLALLNRSEKSL